MNEEYNRTHMDEMPEDGNAEVQTEPATTPEGEVDLSRVRELVLAANPDAVPELVRGSTFDELMDSVEPARQAYQRIASEATRAGSTPKVAAHPGQRSAQSADVESLSPLGKISEGLKRSSSAFQ